MEIQIKKTIKAGNSSAVILPKAWLNKEVRVEIMKKTPEIILSDALDIAKNYINLDEIIGVYLTGSYARKEESSDSDIDILIITKDTDREIIKEGIYNILIVSKILLAQKLDNDLLPVGQMIKEAKPLLNSDYISSLRINITKKNVSWYIDTTKDKLDIIKKVINIAKKRDAKYIDNILDYTLVLRIRTLYIIEKLIKNENYSKGDFVKLINIVSSGTNAYKNYLAVKNNTIENKISLTEAERLYNYLDKQLAKIKKLLENL